MNQSVQPSEQTFAQWIDARMSDAEASRVLGISKSHLSLILKGKRGISLDLAAKIEALTEGAFTATRLQREQETMKGAETDAPAGAAP